MLKVRQDRPKRVGNYLVGDVIGMGASGTVYKGQHVETGQTVAIKMVSTQSMKVEVIKQIKKEMYLLKKISHENIVKYIDFIQTEYHYAIILELIESGSLYGIIKKFGPFQEPLAIIFIKQVLQGLEYLHRQGIVHRDIKGANILTTFNGTTGVIKLTDFGVAIHISDEDNRLPCVGTPYWMAPEAIDIDQGGHITTSCDIWSLGCTIIELLTGNPPYHEVNIFCALSQMVQDPHPPLPQDISPECEDFLMQCFKKEPQQRADAKILLKHPWICANVASDVFNLINSPNPDLPEELLNSIRNHITGTEMTGGLDGTWKHAESFVQVDPFIPNVSPQQPLAQQQQQQNSRSQFKENPNILQSSQPQDLTSSTSQSLTNLRQLPQKDYRLTGLRLVQGPQNQQQSGQASEMSRNYIDEGSFAGSIQENMSRPLDSLRNYNFKKKQNTLTTVNSKREQKMFQDTQEIVNGLSKTREPKKVEEYMNYLSDIMIRFPKAKNYFIKQSGLSLFIDLLDKFAYQPTIILSVLSFLNQITENDLYFLETACLFGVVPSILKYTSDYYSKDIRFEVATFIGSLLTSPPTLQIFLACGGCASLVDLLDTDCIKNKDVIQIGIDMLWKIQEIGMVSNSNFCRMLFKHKICSKLVLIFCSFLESLLFHSTDASPQSQSQPSSSSSSTAVIPVDSQNPPNSEGAIRTEVKYLHMCLHLLEMFASGEDKSIKMEICSDENVEILVEMLELLSATASLQEAHYQGLLHKLVTIFRYLSNEHNLLNKLDNFGLFPKVLSILDSESRADPAQRDVEFLEDLLKIINYFQNLSHPRQEQLVLMGALPVLVTITSCETISFNLRKMSLLILCHFVKTSSLTRKKLVELGGPFIFLGFLSISEQSFKEFSFKILDTLASWLEIDFDLLQTFFLANLAFFIPTSSQSSQNPSSLQLSPSNTMYWLQIIPIINRIISLSDRIAQTMACYDDFIRTVCLLLTDFEESNNANSNTPQIKIRILEILFSVLIKSQPQVVCQIFESHDLTKKLRFIISKSTELSIIILKEKSENLLELYSDSKLRRSHSPSQLTSQFDIQQQQIITMNQKSIHQQFPSTPGLSSNGYQHQTGAPEIVQPYYLSQQQQQMHRNHNHYPAPNTPANQLLQQQQMHPLHQNPQFQIPSLQMAPSQLLNNH